MGSRFLGAAFEAYEAHYGLNGGITLDAKPVKVSSSLKSRVGGDDLALPLSVFSSGSRRSFETKSNSIPTDGEKYFIRLVNIVRLVAWHGV